MADRGNRLLRRADFIAGIPMTFIAGLFKIRKKSLPPGDDIKRIGILATAAIGDTILISAVLKDLKSAYPDAEMVFFAGGTNAAITQMICPQDRMAVLPVSRPDKACRQIRSEGHFDLWIDFGPWPRLNSLLTAGAKSSFKIGFRTKGQGRHYVYDRWVLHRGDQHEMDNLRDLIRAAGAETSSSPRIEPLWSREKQKDYTAVHMIPGGYMSEYKEWNPDNWVSLINRLTDAGHRVLLTGAPADSVKTGAMASACSHGGLVEDMAGKVPLKELPALLAGSRLVVSVNTGIMHMAAAVDAPLVALHGPTSVRRWGPVSGKAVNFESTSPSAGCLDLGFEYDRNDPHSLDTICPDEVAEAALKILQS